jgi:uncharacterized cupin superfamily protein
MSIETVSKLGMGSAELDNSPIRPEWIIDGKPIARSKLISASDDCTTSSYIWECTAGRFNWHYDAEETIYVLEGSCVIKDQIGMTHRLSAGDTIFLPVGAVTEWHVDNYIRKVAFIRSPLPKSVIRAKRILTFLKHPLKTGAAKSGAQSAMFQGG